MRTTIFVLITLLLLAHGSGLAQRVDSSLHGQLTDRSGGAVGGVAVTIRNTATGAARSIATNRQGYFAAPALAAGSYVLEAGKEGFKKARREDIILEVGEQVRLDLVLEVGAISDEITVTGEISPVLTESAEAGTVIPNNYIVNLPLDGRNFLDLALLAPGVTPSAQGSAGSERGHLAFQTNGSRETANAFIFDGVYAIDPVLNGFAFSPSVDAVREFRIHTSNPDAGFGRSGGGQIAVALKQGANGFHGSIYEFFRNDVFDARNFFDDPSRPAPKLRRNQFGAAVGGPLRANSSFFFADYEGLRERRAITRTTNVPTAAERQGDFSSSALPKPINFFTGQPFENGQIPSFFQHPAGGLVAGLYPSANRASAGQNFVSAPTQSDRNDKFDARIDQHLGRNGTLTGRYSLGDRDRAEPFAAASFSSVPGYGNSVDGRAQNLIAGETHTLGTRWINEFRFGYNRISSAIFHENTGQSINQTVGIPDFATRERDLGLSFITVTGLSSLGDEFNNPQDSLVNTYQITDTASFSAGNHLIQFGFDRNWILQDAFRDVQSRGLINFTDFAYTRSAFADLLMGLPTLTGGATGDNPQALRASTTSLFASDRWRIHSDLTLILGLRYEYFQPAHDARDAAFVYDPTAATIVPVGQNGVPRGGYEADKNNLAPRIGIAWRPMGSRQTVIRSAYGVYYDLSPLAPGQGIYFNPPLFNFQLYFPSAQAPITIDNPWPAGSQAPLPPSAITYDRNLRSTYSQQWNFAIQTDFGHNVIFETGYYGSKGTKLLLARDINQPAASPVQPNLRPNFFFQDINQNEASANSIYHSFQSRLECRFQAGLTGLFSYTWAKSLDNASNYFPSSTDANYPQDSNNIAAERGLSSFDLRHRFAGSFAYEMPFGEGKRLGGNLNGFAKSLASGWRLNGIVTLQGGQPLTVALPGELDNSNTGRSILGFGAGDRPHLVGDPKLSEPSAEQWFNQAAFAFPAYGTFGNAGRNIVSGPSLRTLNLSMLKDTRIGETATLQFRAEFFNVLNTPNFGQPNIFMGTPGFGRILSARDGREMQFGLKFLF